MSSIYSIRELTAALKNTLEGSFPFVWVQGQVSNLSRPSSGHLYFSLKDEDASLAAVWFRRNQQNEESFDPLTGEVYADGPRSGLASRLENGQEIICAGRITVYPPRGSCQLVVELMQEAGKGRLQVEFERLKAELAEKGYFDVQRKRPLPQIPRRVAVITSSSGAAVHDFLRISKKRGLPAKIRIYPSLVQGEDAPQSISDAFESVWSDNWAELVVLIRGGGSLEDLWAFNTRRVAEAVHESPVPVLCGIGHEPDVTLADLTADLRAATPSHAAQLLFGERHEFMRVAAELGMGLQGVVEEFIERHGQNLFLLEKSLSLLSPQDKLERAGMELAREARGLYTLMRGVLRDARFRLEQAGDTARLGRDMRHTLEFNESQLDNESVRLFGLDPNLPLERGYALARKADGSFLRKSTEALPGDALDIILADGSVPVTVRGE